MWLQRTRNFAELLFALAALWFGWEVADHLAKRAGLAAAWWLYVAGAGLYALSIERRMMAEPYAVTPYDGPRDAEEDARVLAWIKECEQAEAEGREPRPYDAGPGVRVHKVKR